jgi:hypothetical protein
MRKGTNKNEDMDFLRKRAKLKEYYKDLKDGKIVMEEIPDEYQILLLKYYGAVL